jgi:magnesium-transporting ATPase (P-type)
VGEIILLENEEIFPADTVVIETGLSEGVTFLDTSSIDG